MVTAGSTVIALLLMVWQAAQILLLVFASLLLALFFFWNQKRQYGRVLEAARLWAGTPKVFAATDDPSNLHDLALA